jgi:uncharacterized protein (TIGR02996 family)
MEDVPLLQEILANPDDDLPRLVYADWLDDHGGPAGEARAEFIRVQLELARLPAEDERRPELEARERRLRKRHEREWLGPLREDLHGWAFSRGFLAHVALEAALLLRLHEALAGAHPIHSVRLTGTRKRGILDEVGRLAFLNRLVSLDLSNNYLDAVSVERLVNSPHLRNLATLRFNDNPYGYDAIDAVADSAELGNLLVLELRRNNLTDASARVLADSPHFTQLATLDLRGNAISEPVRSHLQSLFRDGVRF